MKIPPVERLLTKVAIPDQAPTTCWEWQGAVDPNGYGRFSINGRMLGAHRVAYELLSEPVADGLDLDHLCRNRRCVRPSHLEPVSRRENLMRGETLAAAHHRGEDCGFAACVHCNRTQRTDRGAAA